MPTSAIYRFITSSVQNLNLIGYSAKVGLSFLNGFLLPSVITLSVFRRGCRSNTAGPSFLVSLCAPQQSPQQIRYPSSAPRSGTAFSFSSTKLLQSECLIQSLTPAACNASPVLGSCRKGNFSRTCSLWCLWVPIAQLPSTGGYSNIPVLQ